MVVSTLEKKKTINETTCFVILRKIKSNVFEVYFWRDSLYIVNLLKKQVRFLPSSGLPKSMSSLRYSNHGIQIIDTQENQKCTKFDLNTVLYYTRR
jgi:hypothetical protein